MNNIELMHHGVKGMKWGVRKSDKRMSRLRRRANKEGWSEEAVRVRSKSTKSMSNAELRDAINRLEMEKRFNDLSAANVTAGRAFANSAKSVAINRLKDFGNVGVNIAKNAATNIGSQAVAYWLGTSLNKYTMKNYGINWVNPRKGQKDK